MRLSKYDIDTIANLSGLLFLWLVSLAMLILSLMYRRGDLAGGLLFANLILAFEIICVWRKWDRS